MTYCPKCGEDLPEGARFCPSCGKTVKISMRVKPSRPNEVPPAQRRIEVGFRSSGICPKCGSDSFKKEYLKVSGKHGIVGRGYDFEVYICQVCKYSEFYFLHSSLTT
jgi:predicted nucleic-acid-binding Zn-ribbon protein